MQIKFFLSYLHGKFKVTKEEMAKDIEKYKQTNRALGQSLDQNVEKNHRHYVEDLARTANLKAFPPVLNKMYDYVLHEKFQDFSLAYRVVDDENFECYECLC